MVKRYSKLILISIVLIAVFFRLWKIDMVPPSLFGDELDVGYHAYSILKTGRDYSGQFMPLNFHSLSEWRTPLFIYSTVPTVAIFGITPLGVRLPAVIFGILGVVGMYFLAKIIFKSEKGALISALVIALSPWHIQYSRAAFEVTMLLAFLIWGFYLLFRWFDEKKYVYLVIPLLIWTPLIYNTAKLFTLIILLVVLVIWRKKFLSLKRRSLIKYILFGILIAFPVVIATLSGEGTQRFGYLSVFSDPDREMKISEERVNDIRYLSGDQSQISKIFHNKWLYWTKEISTNYLQSFSTGFLFVEGDPNPRHSPVGVGQLYKIEFIALIIGTFTFLTSKIDKKQKIFWLFWLAIAPFPSALTRDGRNHATRLILMLPPLILFISYGIDYLSKFVKERPKSVLVRFYVLIYATCIMLYSHNYFAHYPYTSNRWWHDGYRQAIESIKAVDSDYDRVFLTMADEPIWIFFAGWYQYSPLQWQQNYPFDKEYIEGFGIISHLDKYYFAQFMGDGGIYGLSDNLRENDLYLASISEIGFNLVEEPGRIPQGLDIVSTAEYITGEPAFYLFKKE